MLSNKQTKLNMFILLAASTVFLLAMAPGIVQASCVEAPSGLVSWWPGDGYANDIAGGYHGTPYFDTTFAPGMVDEAFSFDGQDDVVWINNTTDIDALNELTIDAWVRIDTIPVGHIQRFVTITGEKAVIRHDEDNSPGQLHFYVRKSDDTWQDIRVNNILQTETWYHVAGTYDGSFLRVYLDGVEVGCESVVGQTALWPGSAVELSSELETLDGLLDEVEIYNRALNADEVWAIYDAGSAGKCKPDIDVWPLTYDFGNVEMDTLSTGIVSMSNLGSADLTVTGIALQPGSSSDFLITSAPEVPATIATGQIAEIEIIYAPLAIDWSSGVLEITSDDPDEPVVEVVLEGAGVVVDEKYTPPGQQVIVELMHKKKAKKKVTVKYDKVLEEGITKMVIKKAKAGEALPKDYKLGYPAELLELETTAKVEGEITVSIDYSDTLYEGSEKKLKMYHKAEAEQWKDITILVDSIKKEVIGKPTSFSDFGIFEVDAFGLIDGLINHVLTLNLQQGISNSLDAKLSAALQAVDDFNAYNDIAAINTLEAFINAVEAQRGNKIPEADADELIAVALEIIAILSSE